MKSNKSYSCKILGGVYKSNGKSHASPKWLSLQAILFAYCSMFEQVAQKNKDLYNIYIYIIYIYMINIYIYDDDYYYYDDDDEFAGFIL